MNNSLVQTIVGKFGQESSKNSKLFDMIQPETNQIRFTGCIHAMPNYEDYGVIPRTPQKIASNDTNSHGFEGCGLATSFNFYLMKMSEVYENNINEFLNGRRHNPQGQQAT